MRSIIIGLSQMEWKCEKKINGNATKMQPEIQTMEDANKGNAFRLLSLLFIHK